MKYIFHLSTLMTIAILFNGCNESHNQAVEIDNVKQLSQKKSFTSTKFNNDLLLIGGTEGLSLVSNRDKKIDIQKMTLGFKIPKFLNQTTDTIISKSDSNVSMVKKSEIYTILKIEDGVLIGGNFTSVNNKKKKSFVKLTNTGEIDQEFSSEIKGGNVYKIIKYKKGYLIGGTFGLYNNVDTAGIVYIDKKGNIVNNFSNLKKYMYSEINDITVLANGNILLGGAFINQEDSLLNLNPDSYIGDETLEDYAHGIVVLKADGEIDEDLTDKFSMIKNEVYSTTLSKNQNKLYITGGFKIKKDNKFYTNIIRYDISGDIDTTFQVEELLGEVYSIYEDNERILIAGDFIPKDGNSNIRSIMAVNKINGNTLKMDLTSDCANIYQINKAGKNIIILGDGTFSVGSKDFINNISINLK